VVAGKTGGDENQFKLGEDLSKRRRDGELRTEESSLGGKAN
jgi:hypothetical protein